MIADTDDMITDTDYNKYVEDLTNLRVMFICCNKPTHNQLVKYISSFENTLSKNDIVEFTVLVDSIFTRFIYFITLIEKRHKKYYKDNLKTLEKEKLKKSNNEVITCSCGIEYIRSSTTNHLASVQHKNRIDAINWYKIQNGL
jgi:hypothetical protein